MDTGLSSGHVDGKAFIVHDYTGARIACALLSTSPVSDTGTGVADLSVLSVTSFVPYFDYTGNLAVSGTVEPVITALTTQAFAYYLSGVDPDCASGPGSAANSCGVHIHTGISCTDNAGGHYFVSPVTTDPWTTVIYTATTDGTGAGTFAMGSHSVDTGGTSADVDGRAFIIHDFLGGRIACGLLGAPSPPSMPRPQPPPLQQQDEQGAAGPLDGMGSLLVPIGAGVAGVAVVAILLFIYCRFCRCRSTLQATQLLSEHPVAQVAKPNAKAAGHAAGHAAGAAGYDRSRAIELQKTTVAHQI